MEFSTKLHTIKSGWSIVNNEGSQGTKISPKILYFLVLVYSDGKGHNRRVSFLGSSMFDVQ